MKLRDLKEMLAEIDEDSCGDVMVYVDGVDCHLEIVDVKPWTELGRVRIVTEYYEGER
jgi:hypothetical protein